MYKPTDEDRLEVACQFDCDLWTPADPLPLPTPEDYEVEGVQVHLKGCKYNSTGYWVGTLQEAKEAGVLYHEHDQVEHEGRQWVVVLL